MGEIAEMMLDGTMCQTCGEWMNDGEDGEGYPGYCPSCQPHDEDELIDDDVFSYSAARRQEAAPEPRYACTICDRKLKTYEGYQDHYRVKHGKAKEQADAEE